MIRIELLLEFSNSPNIQAVRLPLKFKYILTQYPHMCDQLRQTVKAPQQLPLCVFSIETTSWRSDRLQCDN